MSARDTLLTGVLRPFMVRAGGEFTAAAAASRAIEAGYRLHQKVNADDLTDIAVGAIGRDKNGVLWESTRYNEYLNVWVPLEPRNTLDLNITQIMFPLEIVWEPDQKEL